MDEPTLDSSEVAPLIEALRASTGDARATIREALARLPLSAADLDALGIDAPSEPAPVRPAWADGEPPGFST